MNKFGRYEVLKMLGEGASAIVVRARDTQFEREVALKILKPGMAVDSASFARFAQEAQTASKLFHPHIATVLDMGEAQGRYYIAMRYVQGDSLDKILQKHNALPWEVTQRLAQQIGESLDYAHGQGFLHRDVKPANIMCASDGGFVLTDFGLTRAMMSSGVASVSGSVVGTPYYIAPEIWKGETASPASDQYSFACVLYETITGKVLFPGETPAAVMTRHVLNPPEFTAQWPANVPNGVREVLDRALEKIPAKRYPNLSELATALCQAVNSPAVINAPMNKLSDQPPMIAPRPNTEAAPPPTAPQPAVIRGATPRAEAQPKPANPPRRPAQPAPKPKKKSLRGWALGGGLGLIALCLIFFALAIPQAARFFSSLSGNTAAQNPNNPQQPLLAATLPAVLTQPTQVAAAPVQEVPVAQEEPALPTQDPTAPPTETPPTLVPTIPPDPNPALPLPFSDDFSQGVAAPWRVISGKPVIQDGFLLAAKDELTIEIGNTELQNYILEMEIKDENKYSCKSYDIFDELIIQVSPTLRLSISGKHELFMWQVFNNHKWESLITEIHSYCGQMRLVVNGSKYQVYFNDKLFNEIIYEPAQGPLILQLVKNNVRIGNLTIK